MAKKLFAKDHLVESEMIIGRFKSEYGPILEHSHDFFEIVLVTEGELVHEVNGEKRTIKEGEMVFVRPKDVHAIKINENTSYVYYNCAFNIEILLLIESLYKKEKEIGILKQKPMPTKLNYLDTMKIKEELALIYKGFILTLNDSKDEFIHLITKLILEFSKSVKEENSYAPKWFEKMVENMRDKEKMDKPISYFTNNLSVSYQQTWRLFKKYYNLTPQAYLNQLRLKKSAHDLILTDKTVLDVSLSCGFSSLSHFYRIFKDYYKMTPRQYRVYHRTHEFIIKGGG